MIKTGQWNNTTRFLMPVFGIKVDTLKNIGFINGYLEDVDRCHNCDNKLIYCVFKAETDWLPGIQAVLSRWEKEGHVHDDYDYREGYVVIVLKFPQKFDREYGLFLEGRYSEFSQDYKSLFPEKIDGKESLYYHIFNKTSDIKKFLELKTGVELDNDVECWNKPTMTDIIMEDEEGKSFISYGEVFNVTKLIEYQEAGLQGS